MTPHKVYADPINPRPELKRRLKPNATCRSLACRMLHRLHLSTLTPPPLPPSLVTVILLCLTVTATPSLADSYRQNITVRDQQPAGSVIGQLGAGIPAANPPFTVYMRDDNDLNVLELMSNGTVRLKVTVDRGKKSLYEFLAVASDVTQIQVSVYVLPLTNRAPVFSPASVNLSIPETAPVESNFYLGSANDPDFGAAGIARYEIVSGNADDVFHLVVNLAPNGAKMATLALAKGLSYRTMPGYALTVRAYDAGTPPLYGDLRVYVTVVNVLAYQPSFNASSYSAVVREDARIGTEVLMVFAAQAADGRLTYSFDNQTSIRGYTDFTVDRATGVISVAKNLSFSRQSAYQLVAVVEDTTVVRLLATALVAIQVLDVNLDPPIITLIFLSDDGTAKVTRSANVHDPVAYVSVSYRDQLDGLSINVTLLGGDGYFALQRVENIVYLVVVSRSLVDVRSSYAMSVFAQDAIIPSKFAYKNFTLYVVDDDDRVAVFFSQNPYYAVVESTAIPGSPVVTVSLVTTGKSHENSSCFYRILPKANSFYESFYIDRFSGDIVTAVAFDCNSPSSFRLTINAVESFSLTVVAATEVVVNMKFLYNFPPFFNQTFYEVQVPDDTPISTCVTQVSVGDYLHCPPQKSDRIEYSLEGASTRRYPFFLSTSTGRVCVGDVLDATSVAAYDMSVTATNEGGFASTCVLRLVLIAARRYPPVFVTRLFRAVIPDDVTSGSDVIVVKATSDARGVKRSVTYQIVDGNDGSIFRIAPESGYIRLQRTIPPLPLSYNLTIVAVDEVGAMSDIYASVSIDIVSSSSSSSSSSYVPMFTRQVYEMNAIETSPRGQLLGKVEILSTQRVKYSVIPNTFSNLFALDSSSGEILTSGPMDFDNASFVLLNVQAQVVGNTSSMVGYAQVLITLVDVNDNVPTFTSSHVTINLREDTSLGSVLYVAKATDKDGGANARISYSLTGSTSSFSINGRGELRLEEQPPPPPPPPRSSSPINFSIIASDVGTPSRSSSLTVTVAVTGLNKNAPVFRSSSYRFGVDNLLPVGSTLGSVAADDADRGVQGNVTYFLGDVSLNGMFAVDPVDGIISNRRLLDGSEQNEFIFQVGAIDRGFPARLSIADVTIFIQNTVNGVHNIVDSACNLSIVENQPPFTSVGFIDVGPNPPNCLAFSIAQPPNDYFSVVARSGEILSAAILDREDVALHKFDVLVVSRCALASPRSATVRVAVVVVDVNDNNPTFDRSMESVVYVGENQPPGTHVLQMVATDPDSGPNGTVRYYFPQENNQYYGQHFGIDSVTGWISTKELFDAQSKSQFTLRVFAEDGGRPSRRSSFVLRVVVGDPNRPDLYPPSSRYAFSVRDDVPIGTNVTSLAQGTYGARREYYLVGGNAFGSFAVDTITGLLFVALLLDYESWPLYNLSVMVVDNDPSDPVCTVVLVTVTVVDDAAGDDDPIRFESDPVPVRIREGTPRGTGVHRVAIFRRDARIDSSTAVGYSVASQRPSGKDWFRLDPTTGLLTVNAEIDFVQVKQIVVVVMATGFVSRQRAATVTVVFEVVGANDRVPVFKASRATAVKIFRDTAEGTIIAGAQADDGSGNLGGISYGILSGNGNGRFYLDPTSGLLSLARTLELQTVAVYRLNVSAAIRNHYSSEISTVLLTLTVVEPNSSLPVFDQQVYHATVFENASPGTALVTVNAVVRYGKVLYGIPFGLNNTKFTVDQATGTITTGASFDRELAESYTLTVFAKTDGFPVQFSTAIVLVQVVDANDNAPVFGTSILVLDVPENEGTVVLHTFKASDVDSNGRISYHIAGGNTDSRFFLDSLTGDLWCAPLDRESIAFYNLTIVATDAVSPLSLGSRGAAAMTVLVNVLDDNDNDPVFAKVSFEGSVYRDAPVGTGVLRVEATDIDGDQNGNVSYSLSNDALGMFSVDQNTGAISIARELGRQSSSPVYSFNVTATDRCPYRPRLRTVRVNVTVLTNPGGNGSPTVPTASPQPLLPRYCVDRYTAYVWENNARFTYVTEVRAVVPTGDGPSTAGVTYWISSGNTQNAFQLDPPNSGVLKTNVILDREVRDAYRIDVQAALSGRQSTDGATVVVSIWVQVIDINDNTPFFPLYRPVSLREGVMPGTQVLEVIANDVDLYPSLTYQLVSIICADCQSCGGNNNNLSVFSIDRYSAIVWTNQALDYETCTSYQLTVQVSDQLHSASTQVQISILDDNDNSPVFTQPVYEAFVEEGTAVGVSVLQVAASDRDSGSNGRLTYSLASSAIDFAAVNAATGHVYLTKTATYDINQTTVYLVVIATDQGIPSRSGTATVVLRINELNRRPAFNASSYSVSISGKAIVGSALLRLPASDPNVGYDNSRYEFSIAGGNGSTLFGIGSGSGEVYLLADRLPPSGAVHYFVSVMLEDRGTPPLNSTAVVAVFVQSRDLSRDLESEILVYVQEDATVGSLLASIGKKPGAGQSHLVFNISSGNDEGTFAVDSIAGTVSLQSPLDYNVRNLHRFVVCVSNFSADDQQSMAFSTVTVNVTETNRHRPEFPAARYTPAITENLRKGAYLDTVMAVDADSGIFGVLSYRLVAVSDSAAGAVAVDERSGELYTLKGLAQNTVYEFTVVAEDAGGLSASAGLSVIVKSEPVQPRFSQRGYSFRVPTNARVGTVVGTVEAVGVGGTPIRNVLYFLRPTSRYFAINHTVGVVFVTGDIQDLVKTRRKRYAMQRHKRDVGNITLHVVAQSGYLQRKEDEVEAVIVVDGSCVGCTVASFQRSPGLRGTSLILVIVFAVVFGVLAVTVVGVACVVIYRRKRKPKKPGSNPDPQDAPPLSESVENSPPSDSNTARQLYTSSTSRKQQTLDVRPKSEQSHSASSGRGSVEKNEDIDEEVQMINAVPNTNPSTRIPDSGIQQDDDTLSEFSVHNHREYLARLGIDATVIANRAARAVSSATATSAATAADLEPGDMIYTQLDGSNSSDRNSLVDDDAIARSFGRRDDLNPSNPANLASIIDAEEVFSGSYNWDYLVDWGPQFLPMADLFAEIARLRDGDVRPKTQPTQIVPQLPGGGRVGSRRRQPPRTLPPPLIIDTPPRGTAPTAGQTTIAASAQHLYSRTPSNRSFASSTRSHAPTGSWSRPSAAPSGTAPAARGGGKIPRRSPIRLDCFERGPVAPSFLPNMLPLDNTRSPIEMNSYIPSDVLNHHRPFVVHGTSSIPPHGTSVQMHLNDASSLSSDQEIHI